MLWKKEINILNMPIISEILEYNPSLLNKSSRFIKDLIMNNNNTEIIKKDLKKRVSWEN